MNDESVTDLDQVAKRLSRLASDLKRNELPPEEAVELLRESSRLASEAGSELERLLRQPERLSDRSEKS